MKIFISLPVLFLFAVNLFAQDTENINPVSQIKKIEKDIKSNTNDKETIAIFQQEKEFLKKINNRQKELLKKDARYQNLMKDFELVKAKKISHLKRQSPEYAAAYLKLEELNKAKTEKRENKVAKVEKRKKNMADKKEKRKTNMAAKKEKRKARKGK